MNPLTNVKNLNKLNQRELELGLTTKKSWHDKYKDSAWIFIGGLPYDLTEGDVLCIFSQYGEIVNVNLVRDQKSGKSKGFCFLCYEDQRSTILSVDNFNGAKVLGRTLRVDHVEEYRKPKDHGDEDDLTKKLRAEGCAPKIESSPEPEDLLPVRPKKDKKERKERKKKKKKKELSSSDNSSDSEEQERSKKRVMTKPEPNIVKVKSEKHDSGYDKALTGSMIGQKKSYNETNNQRDSKYTRRGDYEGTGSGDLITDRYSAGDRNGGSAINREREGFRDWERSRHREKSRERERYGDKDSFRDKERYRDTDQVRDREGFEDKQRSKEREGFGDRQRYRDSDRARLRDREQLRDWESSRDRERGRDRSVDRDRHFDRDDSTSSHRLKGQGRNRDADLEADRNRTGGRYHGSIYKESRHKGDRDVENIPNSRDQREIGEKHRSASDKRSDRYRDKH